MRESNTGDSSPEKPIEIPPPRPKRKPMHPYPRKQVFAAKNRITIPEKIMSLSVSLSEQENQSPTSVLSAVGSDTSAREDTPVPNGTESGTHDMSIEARSPTLVHDYELSSSDEQASEVLLHFYSSVVTIFGS